MKITYIGHSGFLAELSHCCLLFDVLGGERPVPEDKAFDIGVLPELDPDKHLLVFASHRHQDHYSRGTWELRKKYPRITYILSKDIPFSAGVRQKLALTEEDVKKVLRLRAEQTVRVEFPGAPAVRVETFHSTDEGVAFYVTAEGHTFFHAGDLNLWLWEEEGEDYMAKMQANFDRFTAPLAGRHADVAFLPLDVRLEGHAFDGMDAFFRLMDITHCFPMHLWKQYEQIELYRKARKGAPFLRGIETIQYPGQTFTLE